MNRISATFEGACAAALVLLISGAAWGAPVDNSSRLPDGGSTKDLTQPGNGGVAGTGLGGSTAGNGATSGKPVSASPIGTSGAPGTGTSVKGSAGQGIDGQGRSDGISTGSSVK